MLNAVNLICADNYFLDDVFNEYADKINKGYKIVYAYQKIIIDKNEFIGESKVSFDEVMLSSVAHETMFITKEVQSFVVFYNENYPLSHDKEFTIKIFFEFSRDVFFLISRPTVAYYPYGAGRKEIEISRRGTVDIFYDVYGKHIGIDKEFIYNLITLNSDGFHEITKAEQLNMLSIYLNKILELEITEFNQKYLLELIYQMLRRFDLINRISYNINYTALRYK